MRQSNQALFSALFFLAFFTLDSKGLTRVEHHGYRPANSTAEQKVWSPTQNQYGGSAATTRNPYQGWGNGAPAANNNYNQWNRFNQTSGPANPHYNANNNFNKTAQWQRFNNTPQAYPGHPNPGMAAWSPQQTPRPFNVTNNWQRQNQSHLYPQLPQQNWSGRQPQAPVITTTPSSVSNNQWGNNYARWNNSQPQFPSAGRPQNPSNNNWAGWANQNRSSWSVAPVTPQPSNTNYWKGQQNYPNGYLQNQTVGSNTWNRPNATNNYGWGANTNNNANSHPNMNVNPNPQSGLSNSGATGGQPVLTNWGASGGNAGLNNWPSSGQVGWGGNAINTNGASNPNVPNNANNWRSTGRDNSGDSHSNAGVPLSPLGGNNANVPLSPIGGNANPGAQLAGSASNGIPLAPIGSYNNGPQPQPQPWNSGNSAPNSWNSNSNSGAAQLAPLAPLSYGGVVNPQTGKGGNTNPYANMFN